ncbi:MAG: hypothetical protein HQM08_26520 [Candidatus Riflebacteria bacterium]|nr:hypothetical protein [Candidatus Riflebacteria bacterium]
MTKLLSKAMAEVSKLPVPEQDAMASWILSELASEQKWEEHFEASSNLLEKLADEALKEHKQGKTKLLDPEKI